LTVADSHGRQVLASVAFPKVWIGVGWLLQAGGVGVPAVYVVTRARHESIGGHLTAATIRLAWHGVAHTTAGMALLICGAFVFAIGSVAMARPLVRRPVMLLVVVPVAAVAGMLVLGVIALIVAAVIAIGENLDLLDLADLADSTDRNSKRGRRIVRRLRGR
jgi:hypothetical protein